MEIRKGICPHCGKYLGLNEAYQTSVCPNCKRRFDTAAAIKQANEYFAKNATASSQSASFKSVNCPHCGAKLAVGTDKKLTVCPTCHKAFSVSSDPEPVNAENSASHIVASQSSGVTQSSSSSTATYQLSFYEQHKKAIWIGIVVIVAIVLIIVLATTLGAPEREIIGKYYVDADPQTGLCINEEYNYVFTSDSYIEIDKDTAKMYVYGFIGNRYAPGIIIEYTSWEVTSKGSNGRYVLRFYTASGDYDTGVYYNGNITVAHIPFVKE